MGTKLGLKKSMGMDTKEISNKTSKPEAFVLMVSKLTFNELET
jgi:hypothetical protein